MKNYLVFYLVLIPSFAYGFVVRYKIRSEIEYVDGKKFEGPSSYSPWNAAFPNVEEAKRDEMCASAEKMRFGSPQSSRPAKAEPKLNMVDATYVIKCTTVPTLYLSRRETNSEGEMVIHILEEENEFVGPGSPEFYTELVDSDPLTCRESFLENRAYIDTDPLEVNDLMRYVCDENKVLLLSYLWKFSETRRFHLCDAAAKKSAAEGYEPVMQSNRVDVAQIFEIRSHLYDEENRYTRIALRCPTSPRIHVFFRNIREDNDVEVLVTTGMQDNGIGYDQHKWSGSIVQ